jgi:predicted GNAT family acetyltransferase
VKGIEVTHDPERRRFSAVVDGRESYLDYDVVDGDTVDFAHTFTPNEQRGRGIATEVVRFALEWADAHDKRVVPSCWFVKAYLDRKARA